MRTGLQPVAISCNKNFYHGPFAALVDARALSENASDASNGIRKPILCKRRNFAELAFCEVRRMLLLRDSHLSCTSNTLGVTLSTTSVGASVCSRKSVSGIVRSPGPIRVRHSQDWGETVWWPGR
jgi:hypothetical protein